MEIVVDILILFVVVQSVLRLSLWPAGWMRWLFYAIVGVAVWIVTGIAAGLSKLQVEGWLHTTAVLQDVAVVCLLDALLCRLRWYPGLLFLPVAFYVLCQLLFTMTGTDFHTLGLILGVTIAMVFPLLSKAFTWLLPIRADRAMFHLAVTIIICLACLVLASHSTLHISYSAFHTPHSTFYIPQIIMDYISKLLFGIANILLIPDILLLIIFFIRSIILLVTTYMQYVARRGGGGSSIYAKYSNMLIGHEPDEAYADYLCAQMEAEAAKDVNLSRLLTKLGPVLGLIGTLISMSPALVGLSTGDISGMAYNMQVVFSATVVGLVISVVGLFTQQLKSRWYQQDISRLEYAASQYMKGKKANEKEA